jgi:hypothetical protein
MSEEGHSVTWLLLLLLMLMLTIFVAVCFSEPKVKLWINLDFKNFSCRVQHPNAPVIDDDDD